MAASVIHLDGALEYQRPSACDLAVDVAKVALQVEHQMVVTHQRATGVEQVATQEVQVAQGRDITGTVVEVGRAQIQRRAAVDQPTLGVVQCANYVQGLLRAAGDNTFVAVIQARGADTQLPLAGQRPFATVEQAATEAHVKVAVATGQRAFVTVIQVSADQVEALPTRYQAAAVNHVACIERE